MEKLYKAEEFSSGFAGGEGATVDFDQLSPEDKRREIARDVRKQLKVKRLTARRGIYVGPTDLNFVGWDNDMADLDSCTCCALGACAITLFWRGKGHNVVDKALNSLIEYFPRFQIHMIEDAFEKPQMHMIENAFDKNDSLYNFAIEHKDNPDLLLDAIMANIEEHGEFRP